MFPEKDSTKPRIRFANFTEDWEKSKLNHYYNFLKGKNVSLNSFSSSKGFPAIAYGHLYTKYNEVIENVNQNSEEKGVLSIKNDLLFPGSSTAPNGTAKACALMIDDINIGSDIIIAREVKEHVISSPFVSHLINYHKEKLFPLISGSTISHMYGKDLEKLEFYFPIIEEQKDIEHLLAGLDSVIKVSEHKLKILNSLKRSLLQKMFI